MQPYVDGFVETAAGFVPRVPTNLNIWDHLGSIRVRIGIVRNQYKVNPGLYCVGNPSDDSPVLVTANYKLSFDSLRKELVDLDAWILVVDTRSINVWCAAGKNTFSTDEVALQVKRAKLAERVSHHELILPQFAATGVAAHELNKKCGFKAIFGPIRAADIIRFIKKGKQADESMRTVTFTFGERLVLVPVELFLGWKIILLVVLGIFMISGIGTDIFSFQTSMERGLIATVATLLGILAGAIMVPLLLPLIPGRQFWLKGALIGFLIGLGTILMITAQLSVIEKISLFGWIVALGSYTAMNFTGATPYTSLSGVEHEMRRGLPLQIGAALSAFVLWIVAPFVN